MEALRTFLDGMTGICAVLLPVLLVVVVLYFSHKRERERNRLIQQLLDKGETVEKILPLLDNGKKEAEKSPTKHFKSAISLISIGLGLMAFWLLIGWSVQGIGAFLTIIGLGELVVAWYLRKYLK